MSNAIFNYFFTDQRTNYSNEADFDNILISYKVAIIDQNMKPNLVADEMFPEGAGTFMDLDEVIVNFSVLKH